MTAGWDHEPLLVLALWIPLQLKTDRKNRAAVHPFFSMTIFCSMNTWKKKEAISPAPSVFSVSSPQLPPFPCKNAHITDQGNAQLSETQQLSGAFLRWLHKALSCSFKPLFCCELWTHSPKPRAASSLMLSLNVPVMCLRKCTATPWSWYSYE